MGLSVYFTVPHYRAIAPRSSREFQTGPTHLPHNVASRKELQRFCDRDRRKPLISQPVILPTG
jgi:hypothetical protein